MLGANDGDLDHVEFWGLFQDCVEVTFATDPGERLGTVRDAMINRFGTINSPTWERVENTVLRVVAWMEEFRGK